MSESTIHTFEDITERLDEIVATVRSKDTSLERSLDLFDEAISLGSKAVDMVDSFDLSASEAQALAQESGEDAPASLADTGASDDTGAQNRDDS